jgi:hypothetical protein
MWITKLIGPDGEDLPTPRGLTYTGLGKSAQSRSAANTVGWLGSKHSRGANENRTFRVFTLAVAAAALHVGTAQAAMKTQRIDYKQGNAPLSGYLVYDDAVQGRRPGVLMAHDRAGFAAKTLADAEMISKLSYVVFAVDLAN